MSVGMEADTRREIYGGECGLSGVGILIDLTVATFHSFWFFIFSHTPLNCKRLFFSSCLEYGHKSQMVSNNLY